MMELGSPVTWTKLCNLLMFSFYLWVLFLYVLLYVNKCMFLLSFINVIYMDLYQVVCTSRYYVNH